MEPNDHLRDALDKAYAVYARYPAPRRLHASPLRDGTEILATLTSKPLRDLTGEQIGPYASWALTTVGNVDDYRHFLPRILEHAVRDPVWAGADPQSLAEKLKHADWKTWPAPEQSVIVAAFDAALRQAIGSSPDDTDASSWLSGLAQLGEDVRPHLAFWLAAPSEDSVLQLASFCLDLGNLQPGSRDAIYWDFVESDIRATVATWLLSDAVKDLQESYLDRVSAEDRWRIEYAIAHIDATRP